MERYKPTQQEEEKNIAAAALLRKRFGNKLICDTEYRAGRAEGLGIYTLTLWADSLPGVAAAIKQIARNAGRNYAGMVIKDDRQDGLLKLEIPEKVLAPSLENASNIGQRTA